MPTPYPDYDFVDLKQVSLPKGWVMLGVALLHEFQDLKVAKILSKDFRVNSIGEKFGALDVQYSGGHVVVDNLLKGYVQQADTLCQDCGYYPSVLHKRNNWVRVLCKHCANVSKYEPT